MPFNISFLISPQDVYISDITEKNAVIKAISAHFSKGYGVNKDEVSELLFEREALGSTGFGHGAAIPHARISGLARPIAVLFRLKNAVDFDAVDDLPVDLVIGLLSPANAGSTHLHALAAISRFVRDETIREAISGAANAEEIYALVANATESDAA